MEKNEEKLNRMTGTYPSMGICKREKDDVNGIGVEAVSQWLPHAQLQSVLLVMIDRFKEFCHETKSKSGTHNCGFVTNGSLQYVRFRVYLPLEI